MVARRYFISGDVQGVGFRYFVLREVQKIGKIMGFVRNLPDGRVEAYAEGDEQVLVQLESRLRKGPSGSWVSDLQIIEEVAGNEYSDFRITF
ncbi:MAG: acylphosphatase [Acidobacteria bacterium]|nr:MAG: acylphosphatase [Acidobacteriota bacterium]